MIPKPDPWNSQGKHLHPSELASPQCELVPIRPNMEGGEPRSGRKNWNIRTPPWTIELHPRNSPDSATHGNPNSWQLTKDTDSSHVFDGSATKPTPESELQQVRHELHGALAPCQGHARGSFQGSGRNGTRLTQHHGFTASPFRFQGETRLGKGQLDRLYLHGFEVRSPEQPCHRNLGAPNQGILKLSGP